MIAIRTCLPLCLCSGVASAQTTIYTLPQPATSVVAAVGIGDLNADGHADFATSADGGDGLNRGVVRFYSGASGQVIREVRGDQNGGFLGSVLVATGDVNGDARPDVAAQSRHGFVRLLSGSDGSTIRDIPTGLAIGQGLVMAGGQDVDRDGAMDYALTTYAGVVPTVSVFSGASGGLLRTFPGAAGQRLALSFVGDQDGDGIADLAIGRAGAVEVRSCSSGALLRTISGPPDLYFGVFVDGGQDINRDGVPDLLITASGNAGFDFGYAVVVSGRDGTTLRTLRVPFLIHFQSHTSARFLGDADGDGVSEIGVVATWDRLVVFSGASGAQIGATATGTVAAVGDVNADGRADALLAVTPPQVPTDIIVRSIHPLALAADRHTLSLVAGGAQALTFRPGAAHSGSLYLFLGSISGVLPGFNALGQHIPLNLDAYTLFTLSSPTQGHLPLGLGFVPASGLISATFDLPPNWPSVLLGLTVHHAAVVLDSAGQLPVVSNAVPISYLR